MILHPHFQRIRLQYLLFSLQGTRLVKLPFQACPQIFLDARLLQDTRHWGKWVPQASQSLQSLLWLVFLRCLNFPPHAPRVRVLEPHARFASTGWRKPSVHWDGPITELCWPNLCTCLFHFCSNGPTAVGFLIICRTWFCRFHCATCLAFTHWNILKPKIPAYPMMCMFASLRQPR